jgi:hypothetical protein
MRIGNLLSVRRLSPRMEVQSGSGIAHLTVVPTNYEPESESTSEPEPGTGTGTAADASGGSGRGRPE